MELRELRDDGSQQEDQIGRRRKAGGNHRTSSNTQLGQSSSSGYLTVRVRLIEYTLKQASELALYAIGYWLWECESLGLEDYLKFWELQRTLQGTSRDVSEISDYHRRDLAVTLEMILRYSAKSFESNQAEILHRSRIWEAIGFKTRLQPHVDQRAHGSRRDTWQERYKMWLELCTVEADPENDNSRGKRYVSWSRGHPSGSTLRQSDPNADIIITGTDGRPRGPTSEIWDPVEFRQNL